VGEKAERPRPRLFLPTFPSPFPSHFEHQNSVFGSRVSLTKGSPNAGPGIWLPPGWQISFFSGSSHILLAKEHKGTGDVDSGRHSLPKMALKRLGKHPHHLQDISKSECWAPLGTSETWEFVLDKFQVAFMPSEGLALRTSGLGSLYSKSGPWTTNMIMLWKFAGQNESLNLNLHCTESACTHALLVGTQSCTPYNGVLVNPRMQLPQWSHELTKEPKTPYHWAFLLYCFFV
jgi:hypothetical protein